jgi:hypothetical protein
MKRTFFVGLVLLLSIPIVFLVAKDGAQAAGEPDIGIPIYPGAKQDPAIPPLNTPFMKNLHLLTGDPFDKVLAWYTQELGKFTVDPQKKGTQALYSKKNKDGEVMTVTITTINVPAGQTKIVLNKGKFAK